MPDSPGCPLTHPQVLELYFMEHRAKIIDIAAYLDRLDRAAGGADDDFRDRAFRRALDILVDGNGERARRILELLSDPTRELPQDAAGIQGATGAYPLTDPLNGPEREV